jgi:hypothetical protein
MTPYPVHYAVARPLHFSRLQLLLRVVAFCVLGMLGLSFGALFAAAYVALPAFAAARIAAQGGATYVERDGRNVLAALRWLASISAWAGLIAEQPPISSPEETVRLEIDGQPIATPSSALWRLVTGLPSAFVLAILCWFGVLVWLWAAFTILLNERVGERAFNYLVGLQRWSIRLLAFQASLVDEYPPFTFEDTLPPLPEARVHQG